MPSLLKSETARANGAKSKGPRTEAGKEKSSRNSLSHGFTARSTIVLECEDPEEFQQLLAESRQTYEPATPAEKDLVDQMVAARWRIRRLWIIETALLDCEIVRRQAQAKQEFTHIDGGIELAEAFRSLTDSSRSLSLISRYESRLSRMHDRAYAALRELQAERKSAEEKMTKRTHPDPVPPPAPDQVAPPAPAPEVPVEQALACSSACSPPTPVTQHNPPPTIPPAPPQPHAKI